MDEEADESAIGAVKYPVMPSLLSLQQMRNRLHLSYLGRKLMKWTALATGRELRKIAVATDAIYRTFYNDVSQAYMLLARSRYFYQNMNKMVLENVGSCANVRITATTRPVTGVKVIQFDVVETGVEPYTHLGLEKGGQQIHEAKLAWLALIKRLILMVELRTSFVLVETANRNANTRMNVLNKVTIPRTKATIHYILIEMEEMAREELYRIKITKKKKVRDAAKAKTLEPLADISNTDAYINPDICLKFVEEKPPPPPEVEISDKSESEPSYELAPSPPTDLSSPPQEVGTQDSKLKYLKELLSNVIVLGKEVVNTSLSSIGIDEFLSICDEAKLKINNMFSSESSKSDQVDPALRERLNNLKCHLREVVNITNDFKNSIRVTKSVEMFIESCEEADNKLNLTVNKDGKEMVVNDTCTGARKRNVRIKSTDDVCHVENKCSLHSKGEDKPNDFEILENFTEHVCELEKMSTNLTGTKVSAIDANNLGNLSLQCKDFGDKLEAYKNKVYNSNVSNLLLTEFPRDITPDQSQKCPNSDKMNKLIELCENLNKMFDEQNQGVDNINEVYKKLDNAIKLLRQFKDEGIQSTRLNNFLETIEKNMECDEICDKSNNEVCAAFKQSLETRMRGMSEKSFVSDLVSCSFDKEGGEDFYDKNCECSSKDLTSITQQEGTSAENADNEHGLFDKTMKYKVSVMRNLNEDESIREETTIQENLKTSSREKTQTYFVSNLMSRNLNKQDFEDCTKIEICERYSEISKSTTQQEETLSENADNAQGLCEKTMKKKSNSYKKIE